jgi:hypothetical protein
MAFSKTTLSLLAFSITTLRIMAFSTTLSITTFNTTTLSLRHYHNNTKLTFSMTLDKNAALNIMKLSIMVLDTVIVMLSATKAVYAGRHYTECCYAHCHGANVSVIECF